MEQKGQRPHAPRLSAKLQNQGTGCVGPLKEELVCFLFLARLQLPSALQSRCRNFCFRLSAGRTSPSAEKEFSPYPQPTRGESAGIATRSALQQSGHSEGDLDDSLVLFSFLPRPCHSKQPGGQQAQAGGNMPVGMQTSVEDEARTQLPPSVLMRRDDEASLPTGPSPAT